MSRPVNRNPSRRLDEGPEGVRQYSILVIRGELVAQCCTDGSVPVDCALALVSFALKTFSRVDLHRRYPIGLKRAVKWRSDGGS